MQIATRRSQRKRRRRFLFKLFFRTAMISAIVGASGLLLVFLYTFFLGPPPLQVSQSTFIYDANDEVINETRQGHQRNWADIEDVSPYVLDAFVAVEDRKFYDHHGFDYMRIGAAVLKNVQTMSRSQGASTITQQYARNLFLNHDKTWDRKAREALYALRLEWHVSKEDILEGYVNTINFGHGAYGIERAAEQYFDVPAAELSLEQAALLAGLPRGPSYYSPYNHPERAKDRQELILGAMKDEGYISVEAYDQAINTPIEYAEATQEQDTVAPYFQDVVERELIERYDLDPGIVEAGGLNIYTTLDTTIQNAAETYVDLEMPDNEPLQTAVVSIDPETGDVKAMVGGTDYETSPYNRAYDARRAPGSTFKPFLYYAALSNGFTPATMLRSEPTSFPHPDGEERYEAGNYGEIYANDFITLVQALAYSDNIYAVKTHVLQEPESLIEAAETAGIQSPLAPNMSLALGASDVGIMEITNAYSPFANGGARVTPRLIERVEDASGNVLLETEPEREQVYDERYAYMMTSMMKQIFNPQMNDYTSVTGHSISHLLQRPAAGKSGSTPNDNWMIGYTPNLITGVWVAFDDNTPLDHKKYGQIAKRIWVQSLEASLDGELKQDFQLPRGVENVDIDLETGLLGDEACGPSYTVAFMKKTAPDQSCTEYIEDDVLDAEEAKEEVRKEKDKLMDKLKRWFTSEELEME
ncbi:LOW QUALITY PROTEIN: multimodular transpeptidase-transglycosylase [Geomicrobium sp. JCM 19039]|nr:LOW QUALITY PROTEIN: multimodular transpeptidase-transglycosylase [Geomicrobium sp. JCM 19039]